MTTKTNETAMPIPSSFRTGWLLFNFRHLLR